MACMINQLRIHSVVILFRVHRIDQYMENHIINNRFSVTNSSNGSLNMGHYSIETFVERIRNISYCTSMSLYEVNRVGDNMLCT